LLLDAPGKFFAWLHGGYTEPFQQRPRKKVENRPAVSSLVSSTRLFSCAGFLRFPSVSWTFPRASTHLDTPENAVIFHPSQAMKGDTQMKKTKASKLTPKFVTVQEVMDALKVSRWTVTRLIEDGDLESKKIRRTVRITKASFDRFVENL
jgi:excisionase family DNA binding protein